MADKIGIGVLGLGARGIYLAKAFHQDPRAQIVAVCDLNAARCDLARRQIGDESIAGYTDSQAMLADPRVQAVVVATNDRMHGRNGLEVIQAGKHLFLEKPMAQTIEECDAMIAAWQGSGTVFLIGLELRYCSLTVTMKEILDRGDIGQVKTAYAVDNVSVGGQYYYHDARRRKDYIRSLMLEKGTHTLDLMNWFIGGQPVRVFAEGGLDAFGGDQPDDKRCYDCDRKDTCPYFMPSEFQMDYGAKVLQRADGCVWAKEVDVDDNSIAVVRYDNGAKMTYVECHFTPDYNRHFTLIGTRGRMYGFYNNEQDFRIELTYRHTQRRDVIYPPRQPGGHGGGDPRIQDQFLRLIRAGQPACPGVIGARNSAAIAIAAAESCETGMPVSIPACPVAFDAVTA
jgi:predicted dehydrogenase